MLHLRCCKFDGGIIFLMYFWSPYTYAMNSEIISAKKSCFGEKKKFSSEPVVPQLFQFGKIKKFYFLNFSNNNMKNLVDYWFHTVK